MGASAAPIAAGAAGGGAAVLPTVAKSVPTAAPALATGTVAPALGVSKMPGVLGSVSNFLGGMGAGMAGQTVPSIAGQAFGGSHAFGANMGQALGGLAGIGYSNPAAMRMGGAVSSPQYQMQGAPAPSVGSAETGGPSFGAAVSQSPNLNQIAVPLMAGMMLGGGGAGMLGGGSLGGGMPMAGGGGGGGGSGKGAAIGSLGGAALGAAVGSVVPGVGTLIGASLGGMLGGSAGSLFG